MEEVKEVQQQETSNAMSVVEPQMQPKELTMWNNTDMFNNTFKMAQILAGADVVPASFRGKTGNCIIAIDIANRMGLSPMVVMQNSQVVQGRFTWTGSACKAMIDSCGRYKKTRYVEVGERGTDDFGVYLEAVDNDGEIIKGVTVTIGTAKKEGWYSKNGSKWQTMPDLMLRYRASAFFLRTECASISMGFLTTEEIEDITEPEYNDEPQGNLQALLEEEIDENTDKEEI